MLNRSRSTRWRWILSGTAAAALAALVTGSVVAASAAAPVNTKEPSITGSPVVGKELDRQPGHVDRDRHHLRRTCGCGATRRPRTAARSPGATTTHSHGGRGRGRIDDPVPRSPATNTDGTQDRPTRMPPPRSRRHRDSREQLAAHDQRHRDRGQPRSRRVTARGSGDQPITYSYQWQDCDKIGAGVQEHRQGDREHVQGRRSPTWRTTIRVKVTAKNSSGQCSCDLEPDRASSRKRRAAAGSSTSPAAASRWTSPTSRRASG